MVPTMSEYFNSWKNSRFILGDASTQRDFVVISRLMDIQNILGSLQIVFGEVKPLVEGTDSAQAAQIEQSLADLKSFVGDVYAREQSGYQHTPEEADVLGAEAQNRATAIAGQVAQIAAKLNISIQE
jgi:Imelysin